MQNLKKLLAVLLIACMLLPLAACGEKQNEPTTTPTQSTTPTEPTAPAESEKQWLPLVDPAEGKTLTIGMVVNSNVTDYDDNSYTRFATESTGVNVTFKQFTGTNTDVATQVSLMIAGNEKLPDIFWGFSAISSSVRDEYGTDGILVNCLPYLKDKDMTHFALESLSIIFGTEEKADEIMQMMIDRCYFPQDDACYCYPGIQYEPQNCLTAYPMINKKWLDKLGLQVPKTVDDLYNVLVAFRDKDPNGNGLKDEIPMTGRPNVNYADPVEWIMNAFIYTQFTYHFNIDDGKVSTPYNTKEYRQGLAFLKKLHDEGLFVETNFTMTNAEYKSLANPTNGNPETVGIVCHHPDIIWTTDSDAVLDYVAIGPLADATGKGGWGANAGYNCTFTNYITTTCSDPELAFRYLDWHHSYEAGIWQERGERGVDWEWSDGKAPGLTGLTPVVKVTADGDFWTTPTNRCWHNIQGCYSAYYSCMEVAPFDPNDWMSMKSANIMDNFNAFEKAGTPKETFYYAIYNVEEDTERQDFLSDLTSYIQKSRTDFICSKLDVNSDKDWNTYLDTLKSLKYDRWVEIAQSAVSRAN